MVSRPFLPKGPPQPLGGAQELVSCIGRGAVLFPGAPVAADRYERIDASFNDRTMAPPGVIGAVRRDGLDRLVRRNLHE